MSGPKWRVGRKLGRTIYRNEVCVGMVDTPEIAKAIVDRMNSPFCVGCGATSETDWCFRCAVADKEQRCSECRWVGFLDRHIPPSGKCPNTGKVARRETV